MFLDVERSSHFKARQESGPALGRSGFGHLVVQPEFHVVAVGPIKGRTQGDFPFAQFRQTAAVGLDQSLRLLGRDMERRAVKSRPAIAAAGESVLPGQHAGPKCS